MSPFMHDTGYFIFVTKMASLCMRRIVFHTMDNALDNPVRYELNVHNLLD